MARDLWLISFEDFYKKADADLFITDQVYYPKASAVGQSFEKQFYIVIFASHFLPGGPISVMQFIYDFGGSGVPFLQTILDLKRANFLSVSVTQTVSLRGL